MAVETQIDISEQATAYCLLQEIIGWESGAWTLIEKHTTAEQYVFTRMGGHRVYIQYGPY
jgi:hypothetical protein